VNRLRTRESSGAVSRAVEAGPPSGLPLHVIFTHPEGTRRALQAACLLGQGLQARPALIAAEVVPYPLPLESPAVPIRVTEQRLSAIAVGHEETSVRVYLCRDRNEAIRRALPPKSIVLIGGRRRWWPAGEQVLARVLRRDGHKVIFVKHPEN
jgi:hypothetical protein